jgi:hypothetical protein
VVADAVFDLPRGFTAVTAVFPEPQWAERYPVPCYLDNVVACAALRFAGGVAIGDVDGDGLPDVLFTHFDAPNALYLNRGDFAFERPDVPAFEEARLSNGAAFADIDNDGDLDLVVGVLGDAHTQLFIQDAPLHFVEQGEARGVAQPTGDLHASMSQCFGDFDLDGFVDLTTSAWRPVAETGRRTGNGLFRNLGATAPGRFDDVTDAFGLRAESTRALGVPGAWGFTPAFVDLDGDGRPELVQTADFETSRLFWNEGAPDGAPFVDGTVEAGVGTEENGMGAAFGDYDNDGDLDYFVTAIFDDDCRRGEDCYWGRSGNRLYRNEGGRRFVDVTDAAGVRDAGWGWGARFFDFDLDGDLDLVATNGIRHTPSDTGYETDPMKLWRNEGDGTFVDVAAELGLVDDGVGRAVVPVDLDGDGDLDLVVTHTLDPPLVWRNDASEGRSWLVVDLRTRETRDRRAGRSSMASKRTDPELLRRPGEDGLAGVRTGRVTGPPTFPGPQQTDRDAAVNR